MDTTCSWSRGSTIGQGSSATVSLATAHPSGSLFAVKSVELSFSDCLQREQSIHSFLNSPHILTYLGSQISTENGRQFYNLFTEYMPDGTLSDVIRRNGGKLDEPTIRTHTRSILEGLSYLHSKQLVHCDIKGRNVLVGPEGAKIADLGCARWIDNGESCQISGTPLFMAPEVARGEKQGCASDVWSVGCTIVEMATGRPPWPESGDPFSVLYRIGCSEDLPEFPEFLSEQGRDFLSRCLCRDPVQRWSADQLLQHPFLDSSSSSSSSSSKSKQLTAGSFFSSPKSILDQSFWDSLGEDLTVGMAPPANRIRQLCAVAPAPQTPNWTWEENWVPIRSIRDEVSDLEPVEPATGGSFSGESEELVLVNNIIRGDNPVDPNVNDVFGRLVESSSYQDTCNGCGGGSVFTFDSGKEFVQSNLNFKAEKEAGFLIPCFWQQPIL